MESNAILETVNSIIFGSHGVWFLIGAALVFWMQAGFAMVEAGFTRAKKYRKYPDEESDGFLYWYCYVYPDRFWSVSWRRSCWSYRKAGV